MAGANPLTNSANIIVPSMVPGDRKMGILLNRIRMLAADGCQQPNTPPSPWLRTATTCTPEKPSPVPSKAIALVPEKPSPAFPQKHRPRSEKSSPSFQKNHRPRSGKAIAPVPKIPEKPSQPPASQISARHHALSKQSSPMHHVLPKQSSPNHPSKAKACWNPRSSRLDLRPSYQSRGPRAGCWRRQS